MTEEKIALVVDDNDRWLERTRAMVASLGYTVVTATNSGEATNLLDQESFDLLVTDNFMEHENSGIDLLMRNWYFSKEIPSILHTSEVSWEQEERLRKDLPEVICVKKCVANAHNPELIAAIQKLLP